MKTLEGFKGDVAASMSLSDINNVNFEVMPPEICGT